jgi:hypothetical protein
MPKKWKRIVFVFHAFAGIGASRPAMIMRPDSAYARKNLHILEHS